MKTAKSGRKLLPNKMRAAGTPDPLTRLRPGGIERRPNVVVIVAKEDGVLGCEANPRAFL
jgi:hypothetical protein